MVSKMSTKQLALEIDQILNTTQLGGKRRSKKNKSKKSKTTDIRKSKKSKPKSKKRLSRTGFKNNENEELDSYISSLTNLRRSTRSKPLGGSKKSKRSKRSKGSKKLKRGLPEKLVQFRKLTEAAGSVIGKKGPLAMKIAKAVKDDLAKKMDAKTIDSDYAGFIKKAIQHLKDNSSHYIKLATSMAK